MTTPGKTASRPLLSIEETIHRRLSVNIEFEYWIKSIWPQFRRQLDSHQDLRRSLLAPVRLGRIMNTPGLKAMELRNRMQVVSKQYPIKQLKIKKVVGEFY
jgi:hypothetical protein